MKLEVNYNIEDNRWNEYLNFNEFDKFIENIFNATINELKYVLNKKNTIELSIILTNDENIRKINCEYRGIDKPTNVLSFPLFENEFLKEYSKSKYISLGDIILSIEIVIAEANEQNKTFIEHLTHLIVHSILHLFGYDHINDDEANIMEGLEIKILEKLNIKNPY